MQLFKLAIRDWQSGIYEREASIFDIGMTTVKTIHNLGQDLRPAYPGDSIISPRPGVPVYDQAISISGTIGSVEHRPAPRVIRAWFGETCIGETRIFGRASIDHELRYNILARLPEPITDPHHAVIAITLSGENENETEEIGSVAVNLVPVRLRERHYGVVLHPDQEKVLSRENIYGSGPPVEQPSPEALQLVLSNLPGRSSIVDVGCGAGAFGPGLIEAGHEWLGLEVNDDCIELLDRRGLPYRKVKGTTEPFPCADREFHHAICIEVLEHIKDPWSFVSEIARVIRERAMFSVPNLEVLPFLKDWEVVPWHLLEADHKNFFTRASLRKLLAQYFSRVEVFSYSEHPLQTRDGVALHVHLFAIADEPVRRT